MKILGLHNDAFSTAYGMWKEMVGLLRVRMIGKYMKEAVVACFEILPQNLLAGTVDSQQKPHLGINEIYAFIPWNFN